MSDFFTNLTVMLSMALGGLGAPGTAPPMKSFDTCYDELPIATMERRADIQLDDFGMPKSWHGQLLLALHSTQASPDGLPLDVKSLPDLSGFRDVPNLRVAMEKNEALARAVRELQGKTLEELVSPDNDTLDTVKGVIFVWLGVNKADRMGRGHFIDGRELAFVERLTDEPFVQMNYFSNPLPIAATAVKDVFAMALDHYYAELLSQTPGGKLLDQRGAISAAALKTLTAGAAALPAPEKKAAYWCNALRLLPKLPAAESDNALLLGKAIRDSAAPLDYKTAAACLYHGLNDNYDWEDHYARNANTKEWYHMNGQKIWFHGYYRPDMAKRRVCYSFVDKKP
ncbi:MAG: hypothetical protein ACAH80_17110 [Alphaproteobacteria bacterium]